jgi:hypothetical protein
MALGGGETTNASDSVPVPNPEQAKRTGLIQLGGT